MLRVATFLYPLFLSTFMYAQDPEWLDPASRSNSFPDDQYLSAFATEVLGKNQSESDAQSKLYEIIKSQISDQISVSINAQTTLNITVENTNTHQKMERTSSSSSEVDLVGLKLDSYYEKRKKSLHAFAYVSIKELSDYHRKTINDNTLTIDNNLRQANTSSSKLEKVKMLVENKRLLSEIQKSARLLTSLSEPHGADLGTLRQTAEKTDQVLDQLFHTGTVTIDHISARLTGEILNAIRNGASETASSADFAYSNSGVESAFSQSLNQTAVSSISESSKITINNASKAVLAGSFILNNSETILNLQLISDGGAVLASTEFAVLTDIIDTKGQDILPPNFEFIPNFDNVKIQGTEKTSIKPSAFTTEPISLSYTFEGSPIPNLALKVSLENEGGINTYKVKGDVNGLVNFYLDESMVVPGTDYLATFEIDLSEFLSISPQNEFLGTIYDEQTVPVFNSAVSVLSPLVWITSSEEGIAGPLSIKVLEPAVKAGLSDLRYAFTNNKEEADYTLTIDAKARKGQAGDIATLTFIDSTISLINKSNGKEIYKNAFFNIKGVGANFDVAQASAFQKTKTKMVDDITYELEYNR